MAGSFAAQVEAWAAKSERRMEYVFKEAAQRVVAEMQKPVGAGGNMPVDTGFLRASLQVSLDQPVIRTPASVTYNEASTILAIQGADLGDVIFATYGAEYARAVEYGARGRAPRAFVRSAAQRWQSIVTAVVAEAQTRVR